MHYLVQHSVNLQDWSTIGNVRAQRQFNRVMQYSSRHESPVPGATFYRIVQVDGNGNQSKTPMRHLVFDTPIKPLGVYPNPVSDRIALNGLIPFMTYRVHLYDMSGRKVFSQQLTSADGRYKLHIPNLENGLYTISIHSLHQQESRKIRILH